MAGRNRPYGMRPQRIDIIMRPPTREELARGVSPDQLHLIKHFLGKTRDQAYAMFTGESSTTHGAYWTEDFTYMEPIGLEYYLEPASRYLHDDASQGEEEFALGMLVSFAAQMRHANLPSGLRDKIRELAKFIQVEHVKFELELDDFVLQLLTEIDRGSEGPPK